MFAAPAAAQTVDTTPTIAADGIGTATLTPDLATFGAGVERVARTSSAARRAANRRMAAVLRAVRTGGVAPADIRTAGLSVRRERVRRRIRYRAEQSIVVTVRDVSRLGPLLDAVAAAGADAVGEPDYGFADPSVGRMQATRDAMADARRRADDAAAVAGLRITGVRTVVLDPGSDTDEFLSESLTRSAGGSDDSATSAADAGVGRHAAVRRSVSGWSTPRLPSPDRGCAAGLGGGHAHGAPGFSAAGTAGRSRPGRPPTSGRSQPPRGRLRSRPPLTSDVEPPPSRLSASRAPERDHQRRELLEREARVVARAAVAGDREQLPVGQPERGPRVAAVGDVGVELGLAGAEALDVVLAAEDRPAVAHEQRPGLQQVARAAPSGSSSRGAMPATPPRTCTQARTASHGAANGT